MSVVPIIHSHHARDHALEEAFVTVSEAAEQKHWQAHENGLKVAVKQFPEQIIEVTLEHQRGTYQKLTGKDSSGPEGAGALTEKVLIDFNPAAFEAWLKAQP